MPLPRPSQPPNTPDLPDDILHEEAVAPAVVAQALRVPGPDVGPQVADVEVDEGGVRRKRGEGGDVDGGGDGVGEARGEAAGEVGEFVLER